MSTGTDDVRAGGATGAARPPRAPRERSGIPPLLLAPAALGLVFLIVPLVGLMVRAPWTALNDQLGREIVRDALMRSLYTASMATLISLFLGIPIAVVLAHGRFRGRGLVRALVTVPLVLPPVVGGVALFAALGRRGVIGEPIYEWTGWSLPFSTNAVIVAETFVAMPFLIIAVEGALRGADPRLTEAASTLGATRWYSFRRVTLPQVMPGIVAGGVLCWARALGEFGATVTFAGSLEGRTMVMPSAVYRELEAGRPDTAIALSLVLMTISVVVLASLREHWISPGKPR